MTILRGRSELKSQFRVSTTILTPSGSNPLKHTLTAEEAINLMFIRKLPGYLDAADAVREGYEDIMNHQLAITAGVQASLINILRQFDPQQFAEKYQEGLVFQKKAKCWDNYSKAYRNLVRDAMENFFGEAFARAYEEQITKLRSTRKRE
jgi:type VI secretion system FHA domain protein